tara:strand:+ start:87 stop:923 length:837 start_codon:yes stop_codon:yes gene_type:complete
MKSFYQFIEESNQILLLQIQEEIAFLEEQISICEDKELAESLASRLSAIKKRGAGIARRAAVAGVAAAALAGGGAAKAADFSGNVNVSRGAVPAQATSQSVRGAVSRAIANPGQAQSASSEKGKMKTTVSGGINVSGRIGGGEKKEKKEKEQSNRKYRNKDEVLKQRAERQAELNKKNKFTTKYKYAVPTGTGGRFNTSQASGPNKVSSFKPVGTNKTGGTNFQRTKIVGDPTGPGSTGRTVGPKKYDRLFGKGGKFAPKGDGSRTIVPSSIGKRYSG